MKLQGKEKVILAGLVLILFSLQAVVTYRMLVLPNPGANDYYSRWAGARALLVEGRNPYALEVTREIQAVIEIDLSEVGRGGFHYPLPVLFLFWPLVYLPYTWAQALWQTLLVWVTMGIVGVSLARLRWQPSPLTTAVLLIGTIVFYPVSRSILLGQFTLHVTLFLLLTLWALQNGRDGWAGVALSLTAVKPQMIILLGPALLLWCVIQKRWRFLWGLLGGGLGLLVAGMVLYPPWVLAFLEDVQRYAGVAGGKNPLTLLGLPDSIRYGVSALLLLLLLWQWWQAWQQAPVATAQAAFDRAVAWTVVFSLIVPFQTGTTNQVLALILLLPWLYRASRRWPLWLVGGTAVVAVVGLWLLFLNTVGGDFESSIMFLPVPLFCLAILSYETVASLAHPSR